MPKPKGKRDNVEGEWPSVYWESWDSFYSRLLGEWPLFVKVGERFIPKDRVEGK